MEHIFSNKDMGISKGLWLNRGKGKVRPKSYPLDCFTTEAFNHTTQSPNIVVLSSASYHNPRDSLKGNSLTRWHPSQKSLGGWDPDSSNFLSCPSNSNVQSSYLDHCSRSREQSPASSSAHHAHKKGGPVGHWWFSLILSFTLFKSSIRYQLWAQFWGFPYALKILRAIFNQANTSKEKKDGKRNFRKAWYK